MERPVTVRVDANGAVSFDVDISPEADPEVLVPVLPDEEPRDEEELRRITAKRLPHWIEVAGGF